MDGTLADPLKTPYANHMARTQTLVQLNDHLVEALDRYAAKSGKSRSALIREALESYLAATRENELTRQLIEGYQRVPQGAADEWGDLAQQLRDDAQRTLHRLDEEEKDAGLSW